MLRFISCSALVLGVAVATPLAAQQAASQDSSMAKKDAMAKDGKDAMAKDAMGKKDAMSKDAMAKHDAMAKDAMAKHDAMAKDAMGHDAMAKDAMGKDAMAKDAMGKDAMGKDAMGKDAMGKDAMGKDAMGKDAMGKDAMGKDAMGHDAMGGHLAGSFVKGETSVTGGYAVATANGHQVLTLTDDFTLGKGSSPFVVLSSNSGLSEDAVWLGELKQRKGAQSFEIPAGTDVGHFNHVVVWSKSSKKSLASADLSHSAMGN
jgi:pentapeptide MXKDX repeat protein